MNIPDSFQNSYTSSIINGRNKETPPNLFTWFNRTKSYTRNNLIYLYDEEVNQIYGLNSGYIKLGYYSLEGKEVIFSILRPGDIFGNLTLDTTRSSDFAQALTDVDLNILDNIYYRKILAKQPSIVQALMLSMSQRVNFMEHQLVAMALWDVEHRILAFLYFFAQNFCIVQQDKAYAENFLTHHDIAAINLTTRQTVSVIMGRLRELKVIYYDRKQITIYLDKLNSYMDSLHD